MLVQIVEEMENEDFHRIAAPIYGRGFVKLYAECVGLDPLPLVKEFMDIYEGRRAPIVRTRDVPVQPSPASVPAPEPPPAPAPEPIPEPPPVVAPMPEPAPEPISEPPPVVIPPPKPAPEPIPEPPPAAEPAPEPSPEPPPVVRGLELFESAPQPPPQAAPEPPPAPSAGQPPAANVADIFSGSPYLSTESTYGGEGPSAAERFKNSLSSVSHGVIQSVRDIPRSVWRITLLALASLVLLALLIWGCVKLYQATSIAPIQHHADKSAATRRNASRAEGRRNSSTCCQSSCARHHVQGLRQDPEEGRRSPRSNAACFASREGLRQTRCRLCQAPPTSFHGTEGSRALCRLASSACHEV